MRACWHLRAAAGIVLAVAFTFAATAAERDDADLILSNLPPKQSAEYKALSDLAGAKEVQGLDMTHAEMWSVPRARLDAFVKAADRRGVKVEQLDDTSDRVLAPMPEDADMSPTQKKMMHKSMDSKAAMGMSMMMLPPADVMEYALTKGMDAPKADAPATLTIPLTDKLSVTARRTGITKTKDGYIWRGNIDGSNQPVTLLWWPSGRLAGTITYGGRKYVIKNLGDKMHGMIELSPDKMPPDHGAADKTMMRKMKMRDDPLVHQGDASMLKSGGSMRPTKGKAPGSMAEPEDKADAAQEAEITLIVAYTKKAASNYSDIEKDLIDVAIAEANQSFLDSGAGNVRVKLVHAYETDYVEDGGSHFEHVYRFRDKDDGYMDEVHELRDKHGADVAALIVDDPMGCGLSIRVGADAPDAFTAVHHECAATMHSLAHEIGHLIGARHDRALDDTPRPFPYGHGYVHGNDWRTIMSYKDSCNDCPRRPIWSSPDVKIDDVPAGDANTDNAKVIREQAGRVANFR